MLKLSGDSHLPPLPRDLIIYGIIRKYIVISENLKQLKYGDTSLSTGFHPLLRGKYIYISIWVLGLEKRSDK